MKVLLIALNPEQITESALGRIKTLAPDYELLVTRDKEAIGVRAAEIEIATGLVPRSMLDRMTGLRWYQQYGAGADWLTDHPEVAERNLLLTNASGIHAIPISEHIMAFLLCFSRGFKASILGQQHRIWDENRRQSLFELDGKRVVLIGVGAIGSRFALIASTFGMEVVGVRRTQGLPVSGTIRTVTHEELDRELPEADFLVLTQPLTPATHHMIDSRRIGLMKPSAYLVNIGRGGTVDEAALVQALSSHRIAGAGLDVFETEPLPESSPLWELENVILTPHYSGLTPRYVERLMEIFIGNLERFVSEKPLHNVVDYERGY